MADEQPEVSFPATHVHEPTAEHTHTAIMLHGRGSNGPEFSEELFSMKLSGPSGNLASHFPGWRWVFPSSGMSWSTAFQEEQCAWFDVYSLTDITARQELQMDGLDESIRRILRILDEETERLGGDSTRIVLGGLSQGSATALWTLLYYGRPSTLIGGFVGTSGWLPFPTDVEEFLGGASGTAESGSRSASEISEARAFVEDMMGSTKRSLLKYDAHPLRSIPVFLGHGTDDAYVDVSLGRQARDVLTKLGFTVQWREYVGAELEGHWLKEPEEMDDIAAFLEDFEEQGRSGHNR
ncbi:hypothetical protein H2199_006287 [Coniosporium tulheliwenetii]|uniref:Uncharacterized protein n=1 Tax=Coniosporium tulheliwenetii TaxID=3383036 RepID=A0ACC2YXH4_9PEZI|nr:hypothetical protein H2199_006287 [Cladosporium sp. JES 115]